MPCILKWLRRVWRFVSGDSKIGTKMFFLAPETKFWLLFDTFSPTSDLGIYNVPRNMLFISNTISWTEINGDRTEHKFFFPHSDYFPLSETKFWLFVQHLVPSTKWSLHGTNIVTAVWSLRSIKSSDRWRLFSRCSCTKEPHKTYIRRSHGNTNQHIKQ